MDEKEIKKKADDLIPYMEGVIAKLKADKKHPAVRTYTATKNSFAKFSQEKESGMAMEKVFSKGRLKEYQNWLRGRKAEWNTVSTYMRTLKAVYNRLVADRQVEYEPKLFEDVYTKVESQTKRSLDEEQMKTLLTADFEALPEDVQCALAYFLLMFLFRGMPFIDLAYLRRQDLKGNAIVYRRHKTGRQMVLRIPKEAIRLFEKFSNGNPDSGYLFPILDEGIEDDEALYGYYLNALRVFNRKLEKAAKLLLAGASLSSYTPRHTWATLAFYGGVPIGIISKALGHSSIKVTETYLKPFENSKVDTANDELILSIIKEKEKSVA